MVCLKGRLAANRANASRSTGPKTEAGKARSRANSLRHGMTGAGVVLPGEAEERAVQAAAATLRRAFASEVLARRLAVLSDRLDRLDRRDRADSAIRVRRASLDAAERRQSDVDALVERLSFDADVAVRRLRMSAEGCDRLIETWKGLADALAPGRGWSDDQGALAQALAGRQSGARATARVDVLAAFARGDTRCLPPDEKLADPAYRERVAEGARLSLVNLVAGQIAGLEACRAALPAVEAETGRAEEADLALFDESRSGELFRRYEQATERHLFRALLELERLAEPDRPDSLPGPPEPPMASFGAEAVEVPSTAEEAGPGPAGRRPTNSIGAGPGRRGVRRRPGRPGGPRALRRRVGAIPKPALRPSPPHPNPPPRGGRGPEREMRVIRPPSPSRGKVEAGGLRSARTSGATPDGSAAPVARTGTIR